MRSRDRRALESSYKARQYEINRTRDQAVTEALVEVSSGRASANFQVGADRTLDAMQAAIERAVDVLVSDHVRAGDNDEGVIAARVRIFVESQPVFRFATSPSRNPGIEMRQQAIAQQEFVGRRSGIAGRVSDLVATALLRHRAETTYVHKIQKWASDNIPMAVLIVVVSGLVTVAGAWKGIEIIQTVIRGVGEKLR